MSTFIVYPAFPRSAHLERRQCIQRMSMETGGLAQRERGAIVRPQEAARLLKGPEAVFGVLLAGVLGLFRSIFMYNKELKDENSVQKLGEAMGLVQELEHVVGKVEQGRTEGKNVAQLESKARMLVTLVRKTLSSMRAGNTGEMNALVASQNLVQNEVQEKNQQIELLEKQKKWFENRYAALEEETQQREKESAQHDKESLPVAHREERVRLKQIEDELEAVREELRKSKGKYIEKRKKNEEFLTDRDLTVREGRGQPPETGLCPGDNGRSDAVLNEVTQNIEAESIALGADVKRAEIESRALSEEGLEEIDRVSLQLKAEEEGLRAGLKKAEATLRRAQTEAWRKKKAVGEIMEYAHATDNKLYNVDIESKVKLEEQSETSQSVKDGAEQTTKSSPTKRRGRPPGSKNKRAEKPVDGNPEVKRRKKGRRKKEPDSV
eukprot:Plantae.Rhodophyta-Hildenbrandia_rubra.ctg5775.p2 GENE.Plantae.Rhodophyta-Hildenbrandia_rubra.ctg5775~~Plantae.Rhodophyta-Hildenbrandia_rubra.ctg5775.p2  ORF type:complete len:487 (+),score=106.08 Plantae.Rhodophyta-Hildenbrandia_rubra.ctg5775:153-1463(+)